MWRITTFILIITSIILLNKIYWYDKIEGEMLDALVLTEADRDSLFYITTYLTDKLDSLPLGSPIEDSIVISSNYGWRKRPLGFGWHNHPGLDIHAVWWDTVFATGNGIVDKAMWMGGYGRCIVIEHCGGYTSTYAHLYKIFVKKGDSIEKGQPIGRAGNSGNVTGPHLHYEIRRHGVHTDPIYYIK